MTTRIVCCLLGGVILVSGVCCQPAEKKELKQTQSPNATNGSPEEVVNSFLTAMLLGDDEKTRSMLTPMARKAGKEIPFVPTMGPSASFRVNKTELQGKIGAYVHTTMDDKDESGQKESAEIVWIVAKTEEGWRIAGAAVSLFAGQDKTVINFEDLSAAKKAIADAEAKEKQRLESGKESGDAVPGS